VKSVKKENQVKQSSEIAVPTNKFGRIVSAIASVILRFQKVHDRDSWEHGYQNGWKSGNKDGYKKGLNEGHLKGHAKGIEEGYEKGKRIIELRPGQPVQAQKPQVDNNIFNKWAFPISAQIEDKVRCDVAKRLKGQEPTDDQWKMIFSRTPSTCVVAGAGSGKSTTMVLRLLVLHHYLQVPKHNIAVVTFTRESRKDFIKKLKEVFALWGLNILEKETDSMVRTFHSRILDFIRWSQNLTEIKAFEFYSQKNEIDEEGAELENPLDIRLTAEQLELMNAAYQHTYDNNELFKKLIAQLVRKSAQLNSLSKQSEEAKRRHRRMAECSARDAELVDAVERLWRKSGHWPIVGIDPKPRLLSLNGLKFFANGYSEELDAYIILGIGKDDRKITLKDSPSVTLTGATTMKKTYFQVYCDKNIIFLDNYAEASVTIDILRGYATRCPKLHHKVEGDLSEAPIVQAFHSTASFLENLGLDVTDAIGKMSFPKGSSDAIFFHALAIFWPAFNEYLAQQSPPVFTFNKMFEMFGERGSANLEQLPDEVLTPMLHMLVDEFQDCGANTISWLRAVFNESRRRGIKLTTDSAIHSASLMVVGDDWQSIYGWRGSSPKFFIDFESYFPSHDTTHVLMKENYRSHQMVIDAAESLVRPIPTIDKKYGIAAHPTIKNLTYPVQILDRNDEHLAKLVGQHFDQGHTILVLYRKNATKRDVHGRLKAILDKAKSLNRGDAIKMLTYHGAKGLEADAVFLIGDCTQISTSPHRNMAYEQALLGMPGDLTPYDTSQGEETLRLAYVAITRAKRHCYWFVEPEQPPKGGLVSALSRVRVNQPFFSDIRKKP